MDVSNALTTLQVLLALLPGFLTAQVVHVLVVREERSPFERVIQALVFTFLSHVLWHFLKAVWLTDTTNDLLGLAICALIWGLALTWTINVGFVHDFLRWCRLTQSDSRPSEWYDAFYDTRQHVILHLKDGRRLFGWPRIYPLRADKGHMLLEGAEWLDRPEKVAGKVREVAMLIDVHDLQFVEFVPPKE
jgi:hypothetical protein